MACAQRVSTTRLYHYFGDNPFLSAFSDSDPIIGAAGPVLRAQVPGARGQEHVTITAGGHFLREDEGRELAEVVVSFISGNPR